MANRKLQGEIDRVLKKVDEGVQVFEQIWDKVYSAATTAQKEKYEGDLKKEIKKLQRLRDQIKTWQGDNSIKDKSKLDSNRKLIEEKMEKFKVCEKETKTKAFSKEGLAQDRTDPKQKAKAGVGEWVSEAIAKLKEQSDEMEAEIETLNSGKRRKRTEENPRVSQLKDHITRHEHHVEMLERVLRAVYNDAVSPDEASDLKESVDYYIECNQDPDFYEDDEMYDTLTLESAPAPQTAGSKKGAKNNERGKEKLDEDDGTLSQSSSNAATSKKGPASPRNGKAAKLPMSSAASKPNNFAPASAASPKNTIGSDNSPILASPESPLHVASASAIRDGSMPGASAGPLMSNVVKGSTSAQPNSTIPSNGSGLDPNSQLDVSNLDVDVPGIGRNSGATILSRQRRDVPQASILNANDPIAPGTIGGAYRVISPRVTGLDSETAKRNVKLCAMDPKLAAVEAALGLMPEAPMSTVRTTQRPSPQRPIGVSAQTSSATPRNPVKVPESFPNVSAPVFDSREVFEQFDPDTLFFIFYYQQGTYQQYLAATELKRQGWRFHKKYLTWFQRHNEPKRSTDEYETGTFIYFDYANVVVRGQGTGWCQRIKSEFVFEYRFLEDELV